MPPEYQTISSAVVALANDPNTVMTFARTTGATDFTRQMAAVAFARGAPGCRKRPADDSVIGAGAEAQ
jgi:hypothetical protein